MSNTNIEDVMVQLTETRNELSEEDLRLWDGLENERVSRIAGDDANKSLTLQVQDSVSGTERRLSTEVIHREQGDLDKLGLLNQLSQSMSAYRIKTDKEIEAERFARDILGINLDARITTAEASFNHKELKLYQDIQEVFTDLDGKYTSMDARIKKYEELLQDITMDSIKITMDNGEINMGAWTILSQAREWDLEILAKMRGFQEKTNEDVNQALEELQNQLPITENIINEIMENLSDSPLIAELRDALNEGIDNTSDLAIELAKEKVARAEAIIDLAYANAQALAAEKAALAESLAAEAQARADEVQEEANRRIESIRQIRADLAQDVGELNDQVDTIREVATADKAGILETVNNYKTELKSDIATVNTELLGALDGVNTLVTEVRNENEVTLNELTTYKSSNDVAVAGLLSKITTNVSDTAANASKITGLTTELATTNTELGKVRNTSANALSKADTAVTANSALATRVDLLAAAITDLGEGAETAVDVFAFNALKAEVETNAAGVTSLVEQVDALGTSYTNLTDGVQANTDAVSTLTVKQSEMNGDISQLSSDVTFLTSELGVTNTALNTKASNQALSNLNTKLTTTDGKVDANTQQLTQLNTDLTTVRDGLETKASTEALNNLATEVTELEGGLAVNASAITNLKSEIDTELNKKATVTAVNGLTTKVEEVEGKTTTNANNLLALNTTVGNVVNGLANKLDASAISDYYTKSQTDAKASEVAAGKVEEFNANLVIGGVNLFSLEELKNYVGGSLGNDVSYVTVTGSTLDVTNQGTGSRIPGNLIPVDYTKDIIISWYPLGNYTNHQIYYATQNASGAVVVGQRGKSGTKGSDGRVVITIPKSELSSTVTHLRLGVGSVANTTYSFKDVQVEQGNKVTAWAPSPRDTQAALDANSTAIQNTNAEVTRVDGRVTATNSAQTLLEGRVQTVEGDITKKADATALSSLDTRVGTVEGQYTSQASDITRLNNSLDTTNLNVGTAQTAAQNAMNAAGAKGKVIFGSSAPAVADRLVQNLWIDTTGNANTPKRWNGSAWVAVTDKVAMDAANAVSALDTVVKTKADVSALNSLTTKVTDEAGKTTANTNSITELNSDIVKINNDLATKANASALSDMYTKNEVDDKAAEIAAGEVNKYDASLVIGGVNLIEKSKFREGRHDPKDFTTVGWANVVLNAEAASTMFTEGETYTASFEYEIVGKSVPSTVASRQLGFVLYSPANPTVGYTFWDRAAADKPIGYKGKITETFKVDKLYPDHQILMYTNRYSTNGVAPFDYDTVRFTNFQIEKGTKATAWSPSPNDVQNSLDANATAINNTNTEVVRVDGRTTVNADNISGLTSRLGTVEGKVSTKAEASALQDYYTKTEAEANATTVAAGEVSKYDAKLQIGGVNLIADSYSISQLANNSSAYPISTQVVDGIYRFKRNGSHPARLMSNYTPMFVDLPIGTVVTYSVKVRPLGADVNLQPYVLSGLGISGDLSDKLCKADEWTTLIVTFATNTSPMRVPGFISSDFPTEVWVEHKEYQIELGTKATSWSPATVDVQTQLDVNATAITNTNSEVSRVDGRVTATNTDITALKGSLTTTNNSVALKADQSAVTALTGRVAETESGLTSTNSNITSLKSAIAGTAESVTANGSQATVDTIGLPTANVILTPNASSMTGNLIKLRGQISSPVTNSKMLIDPTKLYKLRMRYRRTAGANNPIYIAVINYNAVGNQTVTSTNGLNPEGTTISNAIYPISSEIPAINQWREVEYYFKGKSTGASTGSGTLDSPRTFPALAASVDIGVLANYQMGINNLTQEYEIDYLIFEDATNEAANKVNASAISTTNTEVARVDKTVSGHTQQLSNLNASIAGKANTSALDALTVRVTEEEKKSSSQATSITNLNSSLTVIKRDNLLTEFLDATGGGANYRQVSIPLKQNTYIAKGRKITVKGKLSFKHTGTLTASQGLLIFLGGHITFNVNDPIKQGDDYYFDIMVVANRDLTFDTLNFYCYPEGTANASTQTTVHWAELYFGDQTSKVDLSGKADASAVSTLTTQVEDIDGLVTTQAEQLLVLTSDNNDNKNALSVQAKVIDGVKANYMVKMESNGVIGGFGLMQSTGVLGQVVTSFGVNADSFFIGAPASKKQPFIVTTANQVVNGVTYPAGTYIDVALIANATIGTAHIADASITNAKIKELDASKITTGTLDAKLIRVGSTSQFDTGYAPSDVLNNAKSYVDAVEIGSRNLLKDSALIHFKGSDSGGNGGASVVVGDFVRLTPVAAGNVWGNSAANGGLVTASELIAGEQYTYSVMVKTAMTSIGLYCYSGGKHLAYSIPLKSGNVWERVSFTFTQTTARAKNFTFLAGFHQLQAGVVVEYRNFKLEKGNKATDWTPALEDVDAAIASKSKTFTSQPVTPYTAGDLWRNGSAIYVCTTTRASGSYTASDWTLVGDVTANNKSADTGKVNGVAAATVVTNAANGAAVYSDVMSDLKITPVEKTAINQEWNRIQKEYSSLLAQAQALSITTTTYTSAYTGLSTTAPAMSTILASMSTTTTLTAAQRDAYKTQYTTYYTQAVAITKAINDKIAANAKAQADAKSKTFTAQPTTPYTSGDLWRNGATIRVCTVTRASGSYVAADWTLVGDVTSANTAANSNQLGGKASATVLGDITSAKSAADAAASKATAAENQLALWKYPNTTEIDGGKIRTNSVTANQISVANLSLISGNMGTIQVGTANIADLAVDTLKIKDNAVTVPIGVSVPSKTYTGTELSTFWRSYATSIGIVAPDGSYPIPKTPSAIIAFWEAAVPAIAQVVVPRAGGKCRIDISVNVTCANSRVFIIGPGNRNQAELNDARLYLSVYRGSTLIARTLVAPTSIVGTTVGFTGNMALMALDTAAITGNTTYTIKMSGGYVGSTSGITVNPSAGGGITFEQIVLSALELKK